MSTVLIQHVGNDGVRERNEFIEIQVTLYLAEVDAYAEVNEMYEQHSGETYPARMTVGICDLLGGASVTLDAVVAIE
ncbi:hypothetical protein [Halegenticoccus tardaugens]|uniref:hypothetical protein n=1 Tax=Halegenticoccus tardaugens TaxID=2071624 RepID=UPI001E656739|nr:hypothetical protein [Halegenticoccus tardaugens]